MTVFANKCIFSFYVGHFSDLHVIVFMFPRPICQFFFHDWGYIVRECSGNDVAESGLYCVETSNMAC